jgi:hypothetical protein
MDGARMAKNVFVSKPEGRRDIGRPKLRWLDDVEDDIKALGIRRRRMKAQDRNEWTAIKREAKVKIKDCEATEEGEEEEMRLLISSCLSACLLTSNSVQTTGPVTMKLGITDLY